MPVNSRKRGQYQRWGLLLAALALRAVAGLAWPELGRSSPIPQGTDNMNVHRFDAAPNS